MSRWNLAWLLGLPSVVIVGLTIAFCAPRGNKNQEQQYELQALMIDVLREVDDNYVRELTPEQRQKLVEDMINGGLSRLDPYSAYFNADDFKAFEKSSEGAFGGVGIQINQDRKTGLLQVTSPMVGTPAYEAGILSGDLILKVDGKSLEDVSIDQIIKMIQGEPGTEVTLTVLHEGGKEPVDYKLKRAKIEIEAVMADQRKPDNPAEWDFVIDKTNRIAYIRLIAFSEHAATDLRKVVEKLEHEQNIRGLVLDLRDNPGGLLSAAVEISDMLLDTGKIVSIRDRQGHEKVYDAKASGTLLDPPSAHPVAILINRHSASASEIVSAALQDNNRAVIVGERSFGKGSVQNIIKLPNHEPPVALKLTTASYWRPSGANIHRHTDMKDTDVWGVKPNPGYEVKLTDAERFQYVSWRRQRDIVQGKPGAAVAKPDRTEKDSSKESAVFQDRVLEKALEYIRGELNKS
ncbi:MAG TPA: S41 family peptidase [Gemmataceae bacterium]|nr:S41 family peptidase [Gemmataceae bacterium]